MKKTVINIAAVNVISWYNNEDTQAKLKKLPLKMQWNIRKNMKALEPLAKEFGDFRDELIQKRNAEWFVEDNGKCEKVMQPDENGQEQEMLKIKDEFIEDFQAYENDLNQQLVEIMNEGNEVDFVPIDLEAFVDMADAADAGVDMDDVDVISIFEPVEEEVEVEIVEGE